MNFNFSILNLLLLFLFFIFYFIEDRYHKIKNKNLIFFLIFTPLIIYIFGDNLYAKWWIVDDHEIFFYLTQSGNVQQPSFFTWFKETLLNKTEIGQFGEYPRFDFLIFFQNSRGISI
jgi:hypothetical protein